MNGKFVRVLSFIILAQLCSANATFLKKYRIIVGAWFNPGWKRQDPVYFFLLAFFSTSNFPILASKISHSEPRL